MPARFICRGLAVAIALGICLHTPVSTSAQAASLPAESTAVCSSAYCFNHPPPTDNNRSKNNEIQSHIDQLIAATSRGQTIHLSIYELDSRVTVDTLTAAFDRGVNVKVIGDRTGAIKSQENGEYRSLFDVLNGVNQSTDWLSYQPPPGQSSYVVLCAHSCLSDKSVNHQKYLMISGGHGDTGTVVESSSNLLDEGSVTTDNSGDNAWNNAVTFTANAEAYRAFYDEFDQQKKGWEHFSVDSKTFPAPHELTGRYSIGRREHIEFYPRPDSRTSPYNALLGSKKNVTTSDCKNGTQIEVAQYIISDTRVTRQLRKLADEGCSVTVVYTTHGTQSSAAARSLECVAKGRPSKVVVYDVAMRPGLVHSKYLVISGRYDGGTVGLVSTGSVNIDASSYQREDNTLVLVRKNSAVAQYRQNFASLVAAAKQQPKGYGRSHLTCNAS